MKSDTVFITGHGDLTAEEFEEHYIPAIEAAAGAGYGHFVVGDYKGADAMAQAFLYSYPVKVTVYHMFDKPRNNRFGYPTVGGFGSDEERDEAMSEASCRTIAWVRPGREKSGTAKNLKRRKP